MELGDRDGLKTFAHGVTGYIRDERRIDGGWHIAISRTLHLALCTSFYLRDEIKKCLSHAFHLLFKVHDSLRLPLPKTSIDAYQEDINSLLEAMLPINMPYSDSNCNSVKYHWPRHWGDTRVQLGTSANEKSLERKLSETQKKNYKLTNGKGDISVPP